MSDAAGSTTDWNPGAYARFRDQRLRPALDLLNAVGQMGAGDIIDLGCGNGAMGDALKARFGSRTIVGVDASPAMLGKARAAGVYDSLQQADPALGRLLFDGLKDSCRFDALMGNHEEMMPRLAGMLGKGGTLAVQMPHQNKAPSHRVWLTLAEEMAPGRVEKMGTPGVMAPVRTTGKLNKNCDILR